MIPVKLRMKNFLSYEDEEFDFTKITAATVVGKNGAGKSSFCTDAISWSLYGIGSKGGANDNHNYVTQGAESCTVEFTFELNDSTYKIVRSFNDRKSKSSVNLFLVTPDGDEIPKTTGGYKETQRTIEGLLKMSYETFIASSMMFQGESGTFTAGMTDMERKETLISILNIGEWNDISERASADIARLKGEIAIEENNIVRFETVIAQKEEHERQLAAINADMSALVAEKKTQQSILDKNQEKMFQLGEIDKQIASKRNEIADIDTKIKQNADDLVAQQNVIETNSKKIVEYRGKIDTEQKIIDHKNDIEKAVAEETSLLASIEQLKGMQVAQLQKQNELAKVQQDGVNWNNELANKIALIESEIASATQQANALRNTPCSNNPAMTSSCTFLRMANEAAQKLPALNQQKSALEQQKSQNPHRALWAKTKKELDSIVFDANALSQQESRLTEVRRYSSLKARLDSALTTINSLVDVISTMEAQIVTAKENIVRINKRTVANKESADVARKALTELEASKNSFDVVAREVATAKQEIANIEMREKALTEQMATCKTLIAQANEASKNCNMSQKLIAKKNDELRIATIMKDACGKKSGVPSLIVENAVPELEMLANGILSRLMEGRLQIRLDTQLESKTTNTVRDVLRITVLDDGYERQYDTYSGAEKFVVDLALRIAMSKFLSKRSGASVQLFVLDEGVSCADDENRDEVIEAIREISHDFAKVLFVTHINEVKDCLDQQIIVRKDAMTGSHLRVVA